MRVLTVLALPYELPAKLWAEAVCGTLPCLCVISNMQFFTEHLQGKPGGLCVGSERLSCTDAGKLSLVWVGQREERKERVCVW